MNTGISLLLWFSLLNFVFCAISKTFWTGPKYFLTYKMIGHYIRVKFMYIHYDAMKLETFLWTEDKNVGFLNSTSIFIFSVQCLHFCVTKSQKNCQIIEARKFFLSNCRQSQNRFMLYHPFQLASSVKNQMVLSTVDVIECSCKNDLTQ